MNKSILLISTIAVLNSCVVGKESRMLKKSTKEWRESPEAMRAYLDTPFAGVFLVLRENGKFEHTSSGMLKGFDAGTWTVSGDTIHLNYMDSKQTIIKNRNAVMQRESSRLKFLEDSTAFQMRYTILSDQLK